MDNEKKTWVKYTSVTGNERIVTFDTEEKAKEFAKEKHGTVLNW